jgi:xanthine dehydrogenase YagR molybdenum-binding subunit
MPKVKAKVGFRGPRGVVKEIEVNIPEGEPPPWGLDSQLKHVGTSIPRIDGVAKVTGRAKYTYDQNPRGMLWGKMLHSPWGAATIKAMDVEALKKAPGVRAVHVFKEVGRPLLYHGDEVLAIAADTLEQAEDALRDFKVTYERKPVTTTIQAGLRADAPMVFEGEKNAAPINEPKDDAAKKELADKTAKVAGLMKTAHKIVEATYETQVQTHSSLETHGAMATYEKDGSLNLHISTQANYGCKGEAVEFTKLPDDKVNLIAEMVGGGFGGKFNIAPSGRAAMALAKLAKRPVKIMLDREGEHTTGGNRPGSIQKMKAGVAKDGKILAYQLEVFGTGGVTARGTGAANPVIYDVGESLKKETRVFTNGGPSVAMRSPAWPQGVFAMEGFLDEMAFALGMDPLEFRKQNTKDEVYLAQWEMGAKMIGWDRRNKVPGSGKGPIKRGLGMASSKWTNMGGRDGIVDVVIRRDGTVETKNGAQDIGTGTRTLLALITAEEMGLKPKDIKVSLGQTKWPKGPSSGGSKTAATLAPVIRRSAWQAKQKLLELASAKLGVPAAELRIEDGLVAGQGKSLSWKQACGLIKENGGKIEVRTERQANYESYTKQVHGVQFAEVEVDTETGYVKPIKIVTIQDAGLVANKLLFNSQLLGGAIQGISYALHEDRVLDARYGVQMNSDLMMYKIAGPMEMPEIVTVPFDVVNAGNNTSMMGVGEPPNIPTAAAIANAFFNATGVRMRTLPMTPDRVLTALLSASKTKTASI